MKNSEDSAILFKCVVRCRQMSNAKRKKTVELELAPSFKAHCVDLNEYYVYCAQMNVNHSHKGLQ